MKTWRQKSANAQTVQCYCDYLCPRMTLTEAPVLPPARNRSEWLLKNVGIQQDLEQHVKVCRAHFDFFIVDEQSSLSSRLPRSGGYL